MTCCSAVLAIAVAAVAAANIVDYPELGLSVDIPDGYRERPDFAMGNPDVLAAFVEAEPFKSDQHIVIWIQRLRDVIDEGWIEVYGASPRMQVTTVGWRGINLPLIRTPNSTGGVVRTQINAQVPTTPEAILFGVIGPTDRDEDITGVMAHLIASTTGETNWQVDEGGVPVWLIGLAALLVGACAGYLASRLRTSA